MIAALVYSSGFPFPLSTMAARSLHFDGIETKEKECTRESKPNHTSSVQGESLAQNSQEDTPSDELGSSMNSSGRRIIFPCLHQQPSSATSPSSPPSQAENDPTLHSPIKKVPSLNSIGKLDKQRPVSRSPNCVSLPSVLPRLPRFSTEKFDASSLPIPPFGHLGSPPKSDCARSATVADTPIYTKRLVTPFLPPFTLGPSMPMKQKSRKTLIKSILRNKLPVEKSTTTDELESVPSMASMTASESSQPDLTRRVAFDARVWVSEFQRSKDEFTNTWYAPEEMDNFKRQALELIQRYAERELIPTGTGRFVCRPVINKKCLFTCPALLGDEDEDDFSIDRLARLELGNILVVDPRDVFAKLFAKAFQKIFPHSNVVAVKSSDDAIARIQRAGSKSFDLILVEERLQLIQDGEDYQASGSALIRKLKEKDPLALVVGVSAHFEKDKEKLQESGADMTWPKPPPPLDRTMRDEILQKLLLLRRKNDFALKYFR